MKFIHIWASQDPFSHTPMKLASSHNSNRLSSDDMDTLIAQTKDVLKSGQYSKIRAVKLEIDDNTGEVTVLANVEGENPLKKRTVLNEKAFAAAEMRRKGLSTSPVEVMLDSGINLW